MAQITTITSEALQATIRRLLPSQRGFGEDLEATNVIQPIIDLTPTAEGSSVPTNLQTALALDSQIVFSTSNTTDTITSTTGFFRVVGTASTFLSGSGTSLCNLNLTDGTSTIVCWRTRLANAGSQTVSFDLVFFLKAGVSLEAFSSDTNSIINGSARQIADITGNLVNPSGFNPQ